MIKAFITVFLFGLCLTSCLQPKKDADTQISLSLDQIQFQDLVDKFKLAFEQEKDLNNEDIIRYKYVYKFYDLLSNIYIDSIRVHIDSVTVDNLTITTAFHCNNEIVFKSSLTFLQKMNSKQDLLFEFMKGLKPGLDTIVDFAYLGNHQLRLPNSKGVPIIKIVAYPIPIWLPKKE